ncbi:Fanconi anemia group D2 protein-like isoform X2 [Hydractinia symbiolongicarpus]|uniref:Fanconi anemia group D2 protein-like isoform X2 n=1 Tax=Hydractinia symbiolongicarpus TaxID=13093 RepID=UPI00255027A7|nr:Fanconi anemia group D2 protein-like isoform X2 [Hydractinia symbiolongicarpus]
MSNQSYVMVKSIQQKRDGSFGEGANHGRRKKSRVSILERNNLCKLLAQNGFTFSEENDQPNQISVDQAILQQTLKATLKHKEYANKLCTGLEELWEDNYRFCFSLLPTISSEDCTISSRGKHQDSLVRILLGIDILQPAIANLLLEKLPEIYSDNELSLIAVKLGDIDLVHRIVSHLRWLDVIIESEAILEKTFDVISISDISIQRELITCIPDLIQDSNHTKVAMKLRELLLENSHLVTCTLDTLSNMNLKGELLEQIREAVLQVLSSADVADLPVVIKFFQQSVTEHNAAEVVQELRERLQLSLVSLPNHTSTPFSSKNSSTLHKESINQNTLIFDAIKSGVRFHKVLADAWMKELESISSYKEQKVLDLFVLLVLHSIKNRRKNVESLIRSKVKAGHFTEDALTATFHTHAEVFAHYLTDILLLGEIFLRSPEIVVSNYGCNVYRTVFSRFDAYSQQEVVGALVTHVGSGYEPEIESAFLVLASLVDLYPSKMAPFNVFLKGILDYIDNLSISQMRCLFSMISKLSFDTHNTTEMSTDDMYILIRKQLSSTASKNKRVGIIGGMTMVANIGKKRHGETNIEKKTLSSASFEQVVNILEMVKSNVKYDSTASALFYDELANVIQKENIDEKVLNWISESVVSDFQDEFLIDADTVKERRDAMLQLAYDLDEPEEGGITLNIIPLILSEIERQGSSSSPHFTSKMKLVPLASQFRLVRICEQKQNDGDLEGIDALLGCPLVLLKNQDNLKDDEKHIYCTSIIYAINWIRETLNAFSSEEVDTDVRGKIISRIKTLVELHITLEKMLLVTPTFDLPVVDFSIDQNILSRIKSLKEVIDGLQAKKPKKSKTKKSKDDVVEENADEKESKNGNETALGESATFCINHFPASFRQLDLQMFYSLSYGSVDKAYVDTEMHTKTKGEIKLLPSETNFLLADFLRKIEHSFTNANRRTFLKQSVSKMIGFSNLPRDIEVMEFLLKILPSLCELIKTCKEYFTDIDEENDGIVDCDIRQSVESTEFFLMYQRLLQIIVVTLNWDGFRRDKKLLTCFLSALVKNLVQVVQPCTLPEMVRHVLKYFNCSIAMAPITIATLTIKLLLALAHWSDEKRTHHEEMRRLLKTYLKNTWIGENGEKDKGGQFNEHYAFLIRTYISISEEPLKLIEEYCKGPVTELINNKTADGTTEYPCLTRSSFCSFYRSFFEELISFTKNDVHFKIQNTDTEEDVEERLQLVQTSIRLFQMLNSFVKGIDTRQVLITSLKCSRLYLEQFLRSVMPLLDKTLRTNKDLVHSILKGAQQSTRSLQHLCGHSKVAKDITMTTHVPGLKKCLEMFVFRVKATLVYNHCDAAFWLGNLKNRDLHGNEIVSQVNATVVETTAQNEDTTTECDEEEEEDGETEECSESF